MNAPTAVFKNRMTDILTWTQLQAESAACRISSLFSGMRERIARWLFPVPQTVPSESEIAARIRAEYEELLQLADEENTELQARYDALLCAYQTREHMPKTGAVGVFAEGSEKDLYPGEKKEILLSVLKDSLRALPADSRRAHVVTDFLETNSGEDIETIEERKNRVKKILKDYTVMTAPVQRELNDLGFEITDGGKHYKLIYHGDHRYQTTIAKTASDWRSGRNNAAEIISKMF